MTEAEEICKRFDTAATHSVYTKSSREKYLPKLCAIKSQTLDTDQQKKIIKTLDEMNEKERNVVDAVVGIHRELKCDISEVKGLLMQVHEKFGMTSDLMMITYYFNIYNAYDIKNYQQ